MYSKIVWCYVLILTLLDISPKSKLTAQGKSHDVSVHESLAEGITFQEWGSEAGADGHGAEEGEGGGARGVRLEPAALRFGRAALGAAHARTVTLHNAANSTLHLASLAGTTPDFHASFFEHKTVPPEGKTTFRVVFVGRREGRASAQLVLATSRGAARLPVSATARASRWGLWPLLALTVPRNATLTAPLRLTNPTDHPVQIREVYSSGGWVGLELPDGDTWLPARRWLLPPHGSAVILRLRISAPPHHHGTHTAYIRIKANVSSAWETDEDGGGGDEESTLVVAVEARAGPAGEFATPLQLRLANRGTGDPPDQWMIRVGNSAAAAARADGAVWARCGPEPPAPPDTPDRTHQANGVKPEGATLRIMKQHIEPLQPLTPTARFKLDYGKLWAAYSEEGGAKEGEGEGHGEGLWCEGWVRVGRAALPYSVRLLPGTARLHPPDLFVVTASQEQATQPRVLRIHNEFSAPLLVTHVDVPDDVRRHFTVSEVWRGTVPPGGVARVCVLTLRWGPAAPPALNSALTVHTNVSNYMMPLAVHTGMLDLEWEWVNATAEQLWLGTVSTAATRRVRARLRNDGPRRLCATVLNAQLPAAHLALSNCGHDQAVPVDHNCRCVEPGGWARLWLTVVGPARAGAVRGSVAVRTPHGGGATLVRMRAAPGRVAAAPLQLGDAAPYVWSSAEIVIDNTMDLRMRVLEVAPADSAAAGSAATVYQAGAGGGEVWTGRRGAGTLSFAAERLCEPHCYTGLPTDTPEGSAWAARAQRYELAALAADAALLGERRARFRDMARAAADSGALNVSLYLHTTHVLHVPVRGAARLFWPRLAHGPGWAGLAAVPGHAALRLPLRNPSSTRRLLLHAVLAPPHPDTPEDLWEGNDSPQCRSEPCILATDAFHLAEWRVTRGVARVWEGGEAGGGGGGGNSSLPMLLLEPDAELELKITFAPTRADLLTAYLYLRNNLTVMERVQLAGRGAVPSFEVDGLSPGSAVPLTLEVSECGGVRRSVTVHNTGRVAVRVREWRVAGRACAARGFGLAPCAPLALPPGRAHALALAFTPDWTLGRASADLVALTDAGPARFLLAASAPAPLLPRCARAAPPPFDRTLRAAATLAALALLALVLAAAALDAERLLRRARAHRVSVAPRPLDLRSVAHSPAPPPAPAAPVARAVPPRRRRPRKVDPAAESRAFERWRAGLARHDDDSSRSSEDADDAPPPPPLPPRAPPPDDDDTPEERPRSTDDDAHSSASDTSTPPEPDDDPAPPTPPPAQPAPRDRTPVEAPASRPPAAPETPEPPEPEPAAPVKPRPRAEPPRRRATEDAPRARPAGSKHHVRKDKPSKRRERAPPTPPRSSPPPAGGDAARPANGVRWGATWSSVVAARAGTPAPAPPLAPIGSDVPRRAEPARADQSLFFFNGTPAPPPPGPEPDYWRAPAQDRPAFQQPADDYMGTAGGTAPTTEEGSYGGVWGGSWQWAGAYPRTPAAPAPTVRPPPGFGAGAGEPAARTYDPFHSLAAVWSRTALDWRAQDDQD